MDISWSSTTSYLLILFLARKVMNEARVRVMAPPLINRFSLQLQLAQLVTSGLLRPGLLRLDGELISVLDGAPIAVRRAFSISEGGKDGGCGGEVRKRMVEDTGGNGG